MKKELKKSLKEIEEFHVKFLEKRGCEIIRCRCGCAVTAFVIDPETKDSCIYCFSCQILNMPSSSETFPLH